MTSMLTFPEQQLRIEGREGKWTERERERETRIGNGQGKAVW